jgi:4-hydroxyacetophenone monooxygenase
MMTTNGRARIDSLAPSRRPRTQNARYPHDTIRAMRFAEPPSPIDVDDDAITDALAHAGVIPLLAAVAYATGDLSVLREELRPDPTRLLEPDGGVDGDRLALARQLAFEALARFRDGGSVVAPEPDEDAMRRILAFVVGDEVVEDYLPLFLEELSVHGDDLRAPRWSLGELAPDTPFRVAVIGAGMSGIVAAYRLKQTGVPFVILEKDPDVGGTWWENTYPGCRVDVANHFYSYSFAQREDWPQHYSTQEVLLDYFRTCTDRFGLRDHIRFETEVTSAEWSEEAGSWTLCLRTSQGEETLEAQAIISAVGQLNRPSFPTIPGRETFERVAFHSARWRHDVDLRGKRVAVIGTGASAVQFIPEIAPDVDKLLAFQRTPPWLVPTEDYHREVSSQKQWLFRHVPTYTQWYRFWLFWQYAEGVLPAARVDPAWPGGASVSPLNDAARQLLTGYIQLAFAGTPDLIDQVLPTYPPFAKRIVRDNGVWPQALQRDNVELVTAGIAQITPTGVKTVDGVDHEVDVIVYGTGFTASQFLMPMKVVGRGGVELHERWDGDARAYLGITVPHFPNLFLLYGPNTNIVINGSITYFSECEVHYILGCLELLLRRPGGRALDVRPEVHDAYNRRIDEGNRNMAWGASTVNTWYKNAKGRVTQNWPFTLLDYWRETREPDPADYEIL